MSDPGFDSYWSGNTTDICPVGALTTADFRFGARPWELTPVASVCPHTPVGSNITFSTRREVKAGGKTVIKRVMPRQNEAVNEIWIDDKSRFVYHFGDSPDRLQKPMIRKAGELVEAEWDEALALVAEKLGGLDSVAGLAGDRLSNEDLFMFQKLFRKGLKSNNIDLAQRPLSGGDVVAQVGITSGSNLLDLGAGDAVLVVASDLHEEAPVWWLRVKQAADRGAKVVVVNPYATRLDKFAAQVMTVLPGQLLATVNQLVNMAKVDTDASDNEIVATAQMLSGAENLVIFYGSLGLETAETDVLARLLGNLLTIQNGSSHAGKTNSGLIAVWPHNNTQGAWDVGLHPALLPGYKPAKEAGLDAAAIMAGVKDGSVKGLFVAGTDPVGDGLLADRGQLEFLVVQELFMTETAVLADVVLPAQSWAEREGTFTSGERRVQRYYPALPVMGESRADWQILAQIGEKLGTGKVPFAASLAFKEVAKAVLQYKGMDYRTLAQVEKQWPDVGGDDLYYGGNAYENRSGLGQQWQVAAEKGDVEHFDVAHLDAVAISEAKADGLEIIHKTALYTPGMLVNQSEILADRLEKPTLWLHTDDAAQLEIADGDAVTVTVGETAVAANAKINGTAPAGLGLLSGVSKWSGTAVAEIEKSKQ